VTHPKQPPDDSGQRENRDRIHSVDHKWPCPARPLLHVTKDPAKYPDFDEPLRAQEFLTAATRLASHGDFTIIDAVIVIKDADGKAHVRETTDPQPGRTAMSGALWTGLFGLLLGGPVGWLAGAAVGAGAGAVKSVKIHRDARPFALVEMTTPEEAGRLAARYGRHPIGKSVLLHLEQLSSTPGKPDNEEKRMAALRSLDILYTASEERFDRITRLATRTLGTPIALVSLVTEDSQWLKSTQGLDITGTPRDVSFCGHAILGEHTLVVENAAQDPRFADNPLVTGDPHIRFYAGHPLRTADGSQVGTLCVIDQVPRKLTADQLTALRELAALAEAELQRKQ